MEKYGHDDEIGRRTGMPNEQGPSHNGYHHQSQVVGYSNMDAEESDGGGGQDPRNRTRYFTRLDASGFDSGPGFDSGSRSDSQSHYADDESQGSIYSDTKSYEGHYEQQRHDTQQAIAESDSNLESVAEQRYGPEQHWHMRKDILDHRGNNGVRDSQEDILTRSDRCGDSADIRNRPWVESGTRETSSQENVHLDVLRSQPQSSSNFQNVAGTTIPEEQSQTEGQSREPGGSASGEQKQSEDKTQAPGPSSDSQWLGEDEIEARRQVHWANAFARLNVLQNETGSSTSIRTRKLKNRFSPFAFFRRQPSVVSKNLEDLSVRRNFLLKLAKALLYFGAPPHRIESQLCAADAILATKAEIVYLPNIVIITMQNDESQEAARTYFLRSKGRIALTSLHCIHAIYRDVLHDKMGAQEGIDALRKILRSPPIYPLKLRCFLAFICSSIICVLSFGGSAVDMFISGVCAAVLQYLGLNAANKSSMYANVYEISVSIFVAFVARGLGSIPGHIFCYSAVSSAAVVLILPGFTILISALELMSKSIFCGSVRIVYAIIYTLFLGFGLTIGSDFYLVLDHRARRQYYHNPLTTNLTYTHGQFIFSNASNHFSVISGVIGEAARGQNSSDTMALKVVKGCLRDDSWSWWRQPFPWYAMFILVPLYSICSSLSNLQSWRSIQLPVMVVFSCCAFAANKATSIWLPGRTDIVSAAGAFVIGLLGNIYSRVVRGTAFTSMVTGVLFLVPSGIAQGGGLNQSYHSSSEQYSNGFALALRMISLASGVTVGLFVSQVLVYVFGSKKNAAHFAF